MWIGPAPKRLFNVNRFHGRWRWFYDFGTGDLGNDEVHRLDMAVALLNAGSMTLGDGPISLPPKDRREVLRRWKAQVQGDFPNRLVAIPQWPSGRIDFRTDNELPRRHSGLFLEADFESRQ